MKNLSRRTFIKTGVMALGALTILKDGSLFIGDALAALKDAGIKKLKYVHDITVKKPKAGAFKGHVKKTVKFFAKNKEFKVAEADALPMCKFCKFYEPSSDKEWGHCKHVAKKGNKKNQMVYIKGWCQMYNIHSKAKLKKILG